MFNLLGAQTDFPTGEMKGSHFYAMPAFSLMG